MTERNIDELFKKMSDQYSVKLEHIDLEIAKINLKIKELNESLANPEIQKKDEIYKVLREELEISSNELHKLQALTSFQKALNLNPFLQYIPKFLVEFIIEMLAGKIYEKCLDPWVGNGILLSSFVYTGIVKKGLGICIQEGNYNFAQDLGKNLEIQWEHADPWQWIENHDELYDLIIGQLPWGIKSGRSIHKELEFKNIQDSDDSLFILKVCHLLKPDGMGIFIVPKNFINPDKSSGVYANLHHFGLALDAYLALPGLTFSPVTSLAAGIAIIRKSQPIPIFTGLIQHDSEQRKQLIENFQKRKASEDILYGALIDSKDFRGFEAVEYQDRINRISKKFGYPASQLKEIVLETNLAKNGFQECENSLYLPLIGTSPAVTGISDFAIKPQNYIQLLIDPTKADANYIAGLFNSPFGRILRDQGLSGTIIPKLTKRSIEYMTIFLPPISQQKILVDADRKIRVIENDVRILHDQLWSEPRKIADILPKLERLTREESFKEWLESLPFPLASILWTYNAAGKDQKLRYEHLLHFFEASSAFMATIQLSAIVGDDQLRKELLPELINRLRTLNIPFSRATFGTWQITYSYLAKCFRQQGENKKDPIERKEALERIYQIFKTRDTDIIELVTSKELAALFQQVNELRNKWTGHGGVVGQQEATHRHEILKHHLETLQHIFGSVWDRYQLIYPIDMKLSGVKYHLNVQKISGTSTPFEQTIIELEMPLEDGYLYLTGIGERGALRLIPFVRLHSSPESALNACYFFNRKGPKGFRYISYHFDVNSEIEGPFTDIATALNGLLEGSGDNNTNNSTGA